MKPALIIILLVAGCSVRQAEDPQPPAAVVKPWETVDFAPLNRLIEAGVAAGADWPTSPLRLTVELFQGDLDAHSLLLSAEKNRAEGADTAVVVMTRDGLLDDALRGDWHRIVYRLVADGTWRVCDLRRAYRCRRGQQTDAFGSRPCP